MESNKDEATRCLAIAQKHYNAANYPSARKFCQKSISLFETSEAVRLLAAINSASSSANGSSSSASGGPSTSTSTEAHPSAGGAKHRHHGNANGGAGSSSSSTANGTAGGIGGDKREYTVEQGAVVKRVRGCKVTEYYEILSVKRDCEEVEIKKAYRKVRCTSESMSFSLGMESSCLYVCSWHWHCILIRTGRPVRTRLLKVCIFHFNEVIRRLISCSGIESIPGPFWSVRTCSCESTNADITY